LKQNLSIIHITGHPVAATRFWSYIIHQHRYLRLTGGLKWKNAVTTENNKISGSSSAVPEISDREKGGKPQHHL